MGSWNWLVSNGEVFRRFIKAVNELMNRRSESQKYKNLGTIILTSA